MTIDSKQNSRAFFPFLLLLQAVWMIAQTAYLLDNRIHYFLNAVIASRHVSTPSSLWLAVVNFWLCQIILNLLFVVAVWGVARLVAQFLKWRRVWRERFTLLLWLVAVVAVLAGNQWRYPGSQFGQLTALVMPQKAAIIILCLTLALLALSVLIAAVQLLYLLWQRGQRSRIITAIVILLFAGGVGSKIAAGHSARSSVQNSDQPNVFIIGIDALRPDHIGFYGDKQDNTPRLDQFLSHATNFTHSFTTLARTYPAWTSILSGKYPVENGVRYNLMPPCGCWLSDTLAAMLKRHGYATFFAMDDRDFAHIDNRFGFDESWGPPMNAALFMIVPMSDYPLSNLLVNTAVGQRAFPYSYANRNASDTYDPNVFLQEVERHLLKVNNRPIFLAIHFCLPHWPYTWGTVASQPDMTLDQQYRQGVWGAQNQAMDFIAFLKAHGLLHHAIVVIMSDHGEGLGLPGDRLLAANKFVAQQHRQLRLKHIKKVLGGEQQQLDTSYGHGTDVLSLSQYHNLLAIRTYGLSPGNIPGKVNVMVSLIDIKPTILKMVGMTDSHDGRYSHSLLPWLEPSAPSKSKQPAWPAWTIVESGFNPQAMRKGEIIVSNVVRQGIDFYYVDPHNDQVTLRRDVVSQLLQGNKQRAIYYQQWALGFYPQAGGGWQPIIVNLKTGLWSDSLDSPLAHEAPLKAMRERFCRVYAREMHAFCIKK